MYKVFIPEYIPNVPIVPFIDEIQQKGSKLFQTLRPEEYKGLFNRVRDINDADVLIAPHEYVFLLKNQSYLDNLLRVAKASNIILIISAYQDDPQPIELPGTVILRPSAYKTTLTKNEIIMPAYVEDIGLKYGYTPIDKNNYPIVSFVGKAGFNSVIEFIKYLIKNYLLYKGAKKQGIFFRRKVLSNLNKDKRISLNVIIRKNYSANKKTVEIPPEQARSEYIKSIKDAHFVLAPRGDGNYSLRFYEILSLGRIPIIIDTDVQLPLYEKINYDDFVVRVPLDKINNTGDYIMTFLNNHSNEQFIFAQKQARKIFKTYLYMPTFLKYFFTEILPKHITQELPQLLIQSII